jgi:hypothetical protein
MNYAKRGTTYDYEGENRNVDLALPTLKQRQTQDPSLKTPIFCPVRPTSQHLTDLLEHRRKAVIFGTRCRVRD